MIFSILGSVLPGFLLPTFKAWLESRNNIETTRRETALATIRERQDARRHSAETVQAAMRHKPFWVVWSLFSVPLGLWWAVVVFDSIFLFSGDIPDLPENVKPWANQIFNSIFLSGGGVAGAQLISKAIARR